MTSSNNPTSPTEAVAYAAEQIHEAMVHAVREFKGEPQPWQNGNSTAESYARRVARDILDRATTQAPADLEPSAYLKHWWDGDSPRCRVDLSAECEPWLDALKPTITPLFASIPAGGVEERLREAAKALLAKVDAASNCRWQFVNERESLRAALNQGDTA